MAEQKELSCRDVGVDCDFVARADSTDEVIKQCVEHATARHQMKGFGRELYAKMMAAVRTVPAD
jgi:predicted small metal-binding protein